MSPRVRSGRPVASIALALLALFLPACYGQAVNYESQPGPRFAAPPPAEPGERAVGEILVVTWNVQWGERAEAAARILDSVPRLRDADVLVLQELDESGVALIADRLGLGYVYYPATLHPRTGRHFGTALLSPWPLTEDRKLVLPHLARFIGTGRTAVIATLLVGGRRLRVYGLHLATPLGVGPRGIEDQLRAVMRDAERSRDPVVVAGDLNSASVGGLLAEAGYAWPTQHVGPTTRWLPLDHVFTRGLAVAAARAGAVQLDDPPSDHRPVWTVVRFVP